MESTLSPSAAKEAPLPGASHRLLLAMAAAAVVGALGWAGVQVQEKQAEALSLKEELAARVRRERAAGAASRAVPVVDVSSKVAALQRQVTDLERTQKKALDDAAAREKELSGVIAFLRQENTAAQETIQRLSAPPPEPVPAVPQPPEVKKPVRRK